MGASSSADKSPHTFISGLRAHRRSSRLSRSGRRRRPRPHGGPPCMHVPGWPDGRTRAVLVCPAVPVLLRVVVPAEHADTFARMDSVDLPGLLRTCSGNSSRREDDGAASSFGTFSSHLVYVCVCGTQLDWMSGLLPRKAKVVGDRRTDSVVVCAPSSGSLYEKELALRRRRAGGTSHTSRIYGSVGESTRVPWTMCREKTNASGLSLFPRRRDHSEVKSLTDPIVRYLHNVTRIRLFVNANARSRHRRRLIGCG